MQTIKRAAVIFLVLTLVLSCFSPVIAVSAETGPASTSPAANPNASGGETSETTADGTTPTTAVTEETEPPQAPTETTPVIETTVPTETTAPQESTEITNVTEVTEATEVTEKETNTLTGYIIITFVFANRFFPPLIALAVCGIAVGYVLERKAAYFCKVSG